MVDVRPFRGLRYGGTLRDGLTQLISPPYDVISPAHQKALYDRNPYNAVRLELSEGRPEDTEADNRYTRTAETFKEWLREGVLAPEESPAMYVVEESYRVGNRTQARTGLTACVRLEEFGVGSVFPHEYTTPGPKKDRLQLMKACGANFSPLLSLFADGDGAVRQALGRIKEEAAPDASTDPIEDGLAYRLWVIRQPGALSQLRSLMEPKAVYMADGHHRYETALEYRDHLEKLGDIDSLDHAANFVLMSLVAMEDLGLLVLPYHRLVNGLSRQEMGALWSRIERMFEVREEHLSSTSPEEISEALDSRLSKAPEGRMAFAIYRPQGAAVLTLRESCALGPDTPALERSEPRFLSVAVLRTALGETREAEAVSFVHDGTEAVEAVQKGEQEMALLLRPLPMDLFQEVVTRGDRLPPKSTYFYPKLPTGLAFNKLDGELH